MTNSSQNSGLSSYSDSPFVRLLEAPGRVKMLDVFLRKHYESLSASQVSDLADIDPSTFHRNIGVLKELDIIRQEAQIGQQTFYQLNSDSEISMALGEARRNLLEQSQSIAEATEKSRPLSEKQIIEKLGAGSEQSGQDEASDSVPGATFGEFAVK